MKAKNSGSQGVAVDYGAGSAASGGWNVQNGDTFMFITRFADIGQATGGAAKMWVLTTDDYDAIKEIKEAISIPVIANGDIDSYEKAKWVLEHTGADGVMIGRGAVGAPWIFHQLRSGTQDIDKNLKHEIIMEHFDKMIEFYGQHGVSMFRKHTHTYSKGYRGASMLRNSVNSISDINEFRDTIDDFFKNSEIVS